ncbi:hypothetical protein GCM10023091_37090 [Ravibacter arvi]|uniref:Uncharacterized protein n=2 Tax=Ravibacter arvi TaxID=2051041 RepID=A0ABP8M947_9BACT
MHTEAIKNFVYLVASVVRIFLIFALYLFYFNVMNTQKASREDVSYILGILGFIYPVSKELSKAFYENAVGLRVKKGNVLLNEGEHCRYMYFIKRGALMGQTSHQGKKIVTYISIDNEFVSSISGLHGAKPSKEAIIAVEDSELIAIHNDILKKLFLSHFDLNFLFRVMVEKYYSDAQERAHIIRMGNAKERYLYFMETKPGYIERLPLDLVASMLDMKLPTLQKVQKQHQLSQQRDRETEAWCQKIEDYIVRQEMYKIPDLSLKKMAEDLSIPSHKLSSIFNHSYQLTFTDFINRHRVENVQRHIADSQLMHSYTIETLAKKSGFSARSAFYNAFKKIAGMTPAQYRASLQLPQTVQPRIQH